MKYVTKEVKIACAGIVAVVLLYFGINFLKGINMLKATNYYYVECDNIGGLAVSSPVYADGYNIGIVRDISYDHERPGHVTVEIEVEEGLRVPKGSEDTGCRTHRGTTRRKTSGTAERHYRG